jgi:predicted RNA-binding Zn-ribbon protein involved in translation (DUF1610 family)
MESRLDPDKCPNCGSTSIRRKKSESAELTSKPPGGPPIFEHVLTFRCSKCGHVWTVKGFAGEL